VKLINGFNKDIPNEDYHADREYVSSSVLKTIYKSLDDYRKQYIEGESKFFGNQIALDLGSYIHALILEPHVIEKEFQFFEGETKSGEEFVKFFAERDPNKIVITNSMKTQAKELLENFYKTKVRDKDGNDVLINTFVIGGNAEETLCVEMDGVKVKVRFDYRKIENEYASINDIKTTSSKIKTKKDFEKVCKQWGYDISAALYCDAVELHTGIKHDFNFIVLSKADKGTTIWKASEQMLEAGRRKYKIALAKLKKARETNIFQEGTIEIDSI
jgi:hypothetical protein